MSTHKNKLWLRWIAANALSEVFGLGATFVAIALLSTKIERQHTAGVLLAFAIAQWWVLQGKVSNARLWIPANMLAWAVGMPVIFWGMDLAFKMTTTWQLVCVIGSTLLAAGAIVGLIHGRFLMVLSQAK
ncbi:hypothetical protein [Leptolyngbya sp. FACHB-17]|uniref:hypothetical protein n=1 Tax=unclassified Leptolyngbya TaxID=2650499 RepID=UPI0016800883|nr:hypothetical protein [Leptolyngbya sp. FACHB-17]MBD2081798.1 hypothetical protein [Leptolyngbya sp. FACHB-17]